MNNSQVHRVLKVTSEGSTCTLGAQGSLPNLRDLGVLGLIKDLRHLCWRGLFRWLVLLDRAAFGRLGLAGTLFGHTGNRATLVDNLLHAKVLEEVEELKLGDLGVQVELGKSRQFLNQHLVAEGILKSYN